MSDPITLQVAQRGVVTLPKSLRDVYQLEAGDTLTLIDLGGVFVLSPRRAEADRLANQIAGDLAQRGESLESMFQALREAREQYGRQA
jgi:bifunctional DNA-binding transcriptional regulator/antitoxin component of YhaV-PrlF toxin-antitoxin module